MSKIERLAGMPGNPKTRALCNDTWYVAQYIEKPGTEQVFGPIRKSEQSAIRAWNAMVNRIRKFNAGGLIDD